MLVDIQNNEGGRWPADGSHYFGQLRKIDLTWLSYKQVDIAIASNKVTAAPAGFFNDGNEFNIMKVAHDLSSGDDILTEAIFDLGPATAIVIPAYIKQYCASLFPSATLHSAPAVFVKGVLHNHSGIIARQVFLNIHKGYFEIAIIQGSRLLYLNTFRYLTASDVLYYVIFVLEQLGFVPSEENVTLMGATSENDAINSELKLYCGSLTFVPNPPGFIYSETFADIDLHTIFTLLNIAI